MEEPAAVLGRELEVVLDVPAGAREALVDPARLDTWLVSAARADGALLRMCVEEEYGYRRHLVGRVAEHERGRRFLVELVRVEREWDGSDGIPVGPAMTPMRWHEPEYDGTVLEVAVAGDVVVASWRGFAPDALDATRRMGTLLRWSVERASEPHAERVLRRHVATRVVEAPPMSAWLGLGALVAEPGGAWHDEQGTAGGRVLLTVAGRRLAASWRTAGDVAPAGLLDVRIGHERGDRSSIEVALAVAHRVAPDVADAWVTRCAGLLARWATDALADA